MSCSVPIPVNLLLVIDSSASMADLMASGGPTKWQALTDGLPEALTDPLGWGFRTDLSAGLLLFPGRSVSEDCAGEACCDGPAGQLDVEVGPVERTAPQIVLALEQASPAGLSPTASSLGVAYEYYTEGGGSDLAGDKWVLLVTDGGPACNPDLSCPAEECAPNLEGTCATASNCCESASGRLGCVDHEATAAVVSDLESAGVKTVVVALPGAEPYADWLDDLAVRGGAPASVYVGDRYFYQVDSIDDASIWKQILDDFPHVSISYRCGLPLTAEQTSALLVTNTVSAVAIDCALVPEGEDASVPNWYVDRSTDPFTLEILGSYCDRLPADRVDAVVCPPAGN